jgi:hypothetical protein
VRLRLTIKWSAVAPAPTSTTRPSFDANDPAAYPAGAWDRYDTVLRLAQDRGIGVDFNVTAPAPLWATTNSPKPQEREVWNPSPVEFQSIVHALGTRYSGTYKASGQTLPRVSYKVSSPRGSFLTRIHPPPGRGSVRIRWNGVTSRSVGVRR